MSRRRERDNVLVSSSYHNKIPLTEWLKQQESHNSEVWTSMMMLSTDSVLTVRLLLLACRQSPSHCVLTWYREREEESSMFSILIRAPIPSWGLILMTSSKPNHLQRPHLQISSQWAPRTSTNKSVGRTQN